ncbi:MAG TPA: orotidine 5'-phosphate decarboxylase [Candidatus Nanoarchaeia archaeon]|nr:orotidine 5'-phosphate decarboxylase [Candidatus Nanoarchaeia archaeon]
MASFKEQWLEAVERKNSVLCVGLDPADFEMDRPGESLREGENKLIWALRLVERIAPYCAAIKPNTQYWKGPLDRLYLAEVVKLAKSLGLVVIEDAKLADIGDTNESGVYHAAQLGAKAVTLAPYAGNMKPAAEQGRKWGVGGITMCLMSNPEYEREKNKLVAVDGEDAEYGEDVIWIEGGPFVRQFVQLAHDAAKHGIEGLVIGAPSSKNHIKDEEIALARKYGAGRLVLLPGVGKQGGEAGAIWKHFGLDEVIVNVGRAVMFAEGGDSAAAAKHYQGMLNELRQET